MTLADHYSRVLDSNSNWHRTFSEPHDWFLFQDQSQIPGFPQTERYWQESLDGLTHMHLQVESLGGNSLLMLTWGRRDGDVQNPVMYSDFEVMQDRLNAGYLAYASQASTLETPIYIAPVGPVFQDVFSKDRTVFLELYSDDGSHPSDWGSQLAGMSILSSLTGRSSATVEMDVPVEVAELLKESVDLVVLEQSVDRYPLPWIWSQIPSDGRIEDSLMRPLLRIRSDQTVDLNVVDGRLWLENGRLTGEITVSEESSFRIDGGTQFGPVVGDVSILNGRLRLTEVTGSVLQYGGVVQLDGATTSIRDLAQLTHVSLHSDLDEAIVVAGQLDIDALTVGEGLTWSVEENTLMVHRLESTPEDQSDTSAVDIGGETSVKDTGCSSSVALLLWIPLMGWRRR